VFTSARRVRSGCGKEEKEEKGEEEKRRKGGKEGRGGVCEASKEGTDRMTNEWSV
jgi:hypothetical protein